MRKNKPKWLIIHNTGGTKANPLADTSHHTFEIVNEYHRYNPNVWLGEYSSLGCAIGYHYYIEKLGKLTQGRLDTDEGAHCRGMNTSSIGICIAGNFNATLPTKEQEETLRKLLIELTKKWNIPVIKIVPHRHFSRTDCFGKKLKNDWAQQILAREYQKSDNEKEIELLKKQITIIEKIIRIYVRLLSIFRRREKADN